MASSSTTKEQNSSPPLGTTFSHTTTVANSPPPSPRTDSGPHRRQPPTLYERCFGQPRARTRKGWIRHEAVQLVGEFLGTFVFLFIAYLTAQAAIGNDPGAAAGRPLAPATLFYVSVGFGGGVLIALWAFKGISGEMFNPAITLGLCICGAITPIQAVLNVIVQFVAAICAAALVNVLTPGPILFANKLAPSVSAARGVWIEALLTAQLVLTVLLLLRGPHPAKYAAAGIALAVFMGHMTGVNFTGTGINPARSLGPNVAGVPFPGTDWVYYVGPIIGALIASGIFVLLRFLRTVVDEPDREPGAGLDESRI